MTRLHFDMELKAMHKELEAMCDLVQRLIREAMDAFVNADVALAKKVCEEGKLVNSYEHNIERMCLNLIARQQPLATDLRRISAALKIITDMERIGDQAEDIGTLTVKMAQYGEEVRPPKDLSQMAGKVSKMVERAINAYIVLDTEQASEIIAADDEIDEMFSKIIGELGQVIQKDSASVMNAVNYVLVAKYLERIADHSTNIAEWVKFIVTGEHASVASDE